jgi:hypothetical protein
MGQVHAMEGIHTESGWSGREQREVWKAVLPIPTQARGRTDQDVFSAL